MFIYIFGVEAHATSAVNNPDWQLATTAVITSCRLSSVTQQRHHTPHVEIPLNVPLPFISAWFNPVHLPCPSCVYRQLHDMTPSRYNAGLQFEGPNGFTVSSLTLFMTIFSLTQIVSRVHTALSACFENR